MVVRNLIFFVINWKQVSVIFLRLLSRFFLIRTKFSIRIYISIKMVYSMIASFDFEIWWQFWNMACFLNCQTLFFFFRIWWDNTNIIRKSKVSSFRNAWLKLIFSFLKHQNLVWKPYPNHAIFLFNVSPFTRSPVLNNGF